MSYSDPDVGLPLAAAAEEAGVSIYTVGMWAVRGKLRIVGYNERGHALYHRADVMAAESSTRASRRSSRHPDRQSESVC